MSGEIILQRVLHPDPHGKRQDNFEYAKSQYQKRIAQEGLDSSPIIQVALQVADHYQDRLLDEPRWVNFEVGDYGTDMNVGSHQYRQSLLADISADLDSTSQLGRELTAAASSIHDIGEAGIIIETGERVSDVPKPTKMKDPRKFELLEARAALKMIRDVNLDPQERDALMEVYCRLITSEITADEYEQMSGTRIGSWSESVDWSTPKRGFEISQYYGYKLTAVQQLQLIKRPVVLSPEEIFRLVGWTDRDVHKMDDQLRHDFFLSDQMRRMFVYKCGWVEQIIKECRAGRPSALYFARKFHQEVQQSKVGLDLGVDLDDICPGFAELGQALNGHQ